jgi:hypothetical protein
MRTPGAADGPHRSMYHAVQQQSARESQRGGGSFLNLYLICDFPRSNNTGLALLPWVAVSPVLNGLSDVRS